MKRIGGKSHSNPSSAAMTSQTSESECDATSSGPYDVNASSNGDFEVAPDMLEKLNALRFLLETDLIACDAKWTLFVAAALSYRYDTQLKPFPPRFVSDQNGLDIDALILVINDTPKLRVVLQNIVEQNFDEFDADVLDLLHHVLIVQREPMLHLVDDSEFDVILSNMGQSEQLPRPTHIFKVCHMPIIHEAIQEEPAFIENELPPKLAFHGNRLDCFFAMLTQAGGSKQQPPNTENAGDEVDASIKLTTDLNVALQDSPNGAGWGASSCGSMISCVAFCEFDNYPEFVFIDNESSLIEVRKPDLVRVRHLLFYGSRFPDDDEPEEKHVSSWIGRNKYSLSLACYMLLLASISMANSGSGQYWKQIVTKKAHIFFDFCRRIFAMD
ncbi:protein mono-ADP-ribosyltransferase Parp16 [Anastrepha ludens]|uniref:protein mono-ADP-ribosyltransferase Parp16 n=1 Tax=Anastrepha ludens TaxID=28586 RepID=UPI0023B09CCC|nr:protein mono-ADP-ribosyltransferase Parp16 [Anastrepha ludens]